MEVVNYSTQQALSKLFANKNEDLHHTILLAGLNLQHAAIYSLAKN